MTVDSEIAEIEQRVNAAMVAAIQAAGQLAQVAIQIRVAQLRRAAQAEREVQHEVQDRIRTQQLTDSAAWRAAMRPQWWRTAGAEDIAAVWRAASTWQDVDPRAAAARQVVIERLAERGVHVDVERPEQPTPDDVAWLSEALDRAAAERDERRERDERNSAPSEGERLDDPQVIDGSTIEPRGERLDPEQAAKRREREAARDAEARRRQDRAADLVRQVWPAERAERVMGGEAWGALAYKLDELQQQGHDVEALLRGVDGFIDRAKTPAAFAYRRITDTAEGIVDLGTVRSDGSAVEPPVADDPARLVGDGRLSERERSDGQVPRASAQVEHDQDDTVNAVDIEPTSSMGPVEPGTDEGRAAKTAARGFPTSTRQVLAEASQTGRGGTGRAASGAESARPLVRRDGRDPQER